MASTTTNAGRLALLNQSIDLLGDTIKVMLLGTGYTADPDHQFVSAINSHELSGTGYTGGFSGSGRKTLASKTAAKDDAANIAYFDAADVTWTAIDAGTVGFAAIIKENTSDADSEVIAIIDLAPDVPTNGGDYTLQWSSTEGILKLT